MDTRQAGTHLSGSFWTLAALTVTWWSLAPGLYFLFSGEVTWGTLLSALGVAALVVTVSRPIVLKLQARLVQRPLAVLFVVSVVVVALLELWMALSFASGSPYSPGLLSLHAAVLLLGGLAISTQLRPVQRGA
jgi:predicted PurR-regulated permease PerM